MKFSIIDFSAPILPQLYALSGPIATPLVSAITIGHHMYSQFGDPEWLAKTVGIGAFLGFEACGGACVAAAIKLHRKHIHNIDFWICLLGIVAYMVSPSLIIELGYGPLIFAILAAFAVFAGNTYFSIDKEEQSLAIQTKLDTNKINAETRLTKAKQAVNTAPTVVPTKSTNVKTYICPYCHVDQEKAQRYSVHMRYCKEKPGDSAE